MAGFGSAGSLLAVAALVFVLASALVAFHGWPDVGPQGSAVPIRVSGSHSPSGSATSTRLAAAASLAGARARRSSSAGAASVSSSSGPAGTAGRAGAALGSPAAGQQPQSPSGAAPQPTQPTEPTQPASSCASCGSPPTGSPHTGTHRPALPKIAIVADGAEVREFGFQAPQFAWRAIG